MNTTITMKQLIFRNILGALILTIIEFLFYAFIFLLIDIIPWVNTNLSNALGIEPSRINWGNYLIACSIAYPILFAFLFIIMLIYDIQIRRTYQ